MTLETAVDPPEPEIMATNHSHLTIFSRQEKTRANLTAECRQEAVNAAVKDAQEKWKALTDDKLSEAERLAKMTEDEKKEYLQDKKEKDLAAREAEVTKKELMAEAKNTLASDGLPQELAEVLDYTDADACKKSMDTVKKAFQKAVEVAVEERLKGGKPPKKATETKDEDILKQQVYNAMMGKFQ